MYGNFKILIILVDGYYNVFLIGYGLYLFVFLVVVNVVVFDVVNEEYSIKKI